MDLALTCSAAHHSLAPAPGSPVLDLHTHLLALVAPFAIGDEFLPGVRLAGTSTELGLRYRFDVRGDRLWVDVGPVERVRRFAARSEYLGFGYRTEGGRAQAAGEVGMELCQVLAERVRANEGAVLSGIVDESVSEADPEARVREVTVRRALEPSGLSGAHFYTLNPYVGCVIGCRFCYAQTPLAGMRSMMGLQEYDWGAYVEVRQNLPDVLVDELATERPLPIKISPIVSDAYQPVEKRYELTRRCLEAVAASDRGWVPMCLTRSKLILRDLDLWASIEGAWAGVSIPTMDDEVRRHFEPRSASVEERLLVLDELRRVGVNTVAVVQPMMAGPVNEFADALAARCDGVVLDLLAEEEGAAADFDDPRYRETRRQDWQLERALELRDELRARGVDVWRQELPPRYCQPAGSEPSQA